MPPLALTRLNITKPEAGIVRVVSGAKVTVYDTMADGSSPVLEDGTVQDGAVKSVLYSDRGGVGIEDNPVITDSQGLAEFYKSSDAVHLHILAVDNTKFGIPWYQISNGGVEVGDTNINVKSYPDFAQAVSAMNGNTILHVPAGDYSEFTTKAKVTPIAPSNTLGRFVMRGEGSDSTRINLILRNDLDFLKLDNLDFVEISGMRIIGSGGSGSGLNTGRCITIDGCSYGRYDNMWLQNWPSWAIQTLFGHAEDNVENYFHKIRISGNVADGSVKLHQNSFDHQFHHCVFLPAVGLGTYISGCHGTKMLGCGWEKAGDDSPFLKIDGATRLTDIIGGWFEHSGTSPVTHHFIELENTRSTTITRVIFNRVGVGGTTLKAIKGTGPNPNLNLTVGWNYGATRIAPTGTDDYSFFAADTVQLVGDDAVLSGLDGVTETPFRVIHGDAIGGLARTSGRRLKLRGMDNAAEGALTDINDGDIIYNSQLKRYRGYSNGAWQNLNTTP